MPSINFGTTSYYAQLMIRIKADLAARMEALRDYPDDEVRGFATRIPWQPSRPSLLQP